MIALTLTTPPSPAPVASDAVAFPDALALLEASARLHRAADVGALRHEMGFAAHRLLPSASVHCDLAARRVPDRTTGHEIVRSTGSAPALVLVALRSPGRMSPRDALVLGLLAAAAASAFDLVRLRPVPPPIDPGRLRTLTPRELQVLALVSRGATNAQVGLRLGIGARTVEKHLEHIAVKLDARGRTAASALYLGAIAAPR